MSNKIPLVSIIIPSYNAQKFIVKAIESSLNQSYPNKEIIVVDDGSTDNTLQVIKDFKDSIIIISQENAGVSVARNIGANKARGEWLAFLDADDIWHKHKIKNQIDNIKNCSWGHTNSLYIGPTQDGKTYRSDLTTQHDGYIFDKLLINNFITTSTVIIKKSVFFEVGGFNEKVKLLEDWRLWLKVAYQFPIAYLPKSQAEYRVYNESCSRKSRGILSAHLNTINDTFIYYPKLAEYPKLKKKALRESYIICSYIAEEQKDYYFTLKCITISAFYGHSMFDCLKRILKNSTLLILTFLKIYPNK